MKKDVENDFFKAFKPFGVVDKCFSWMEKQYNLGYQDAAVNNTDNNSAPDSKWQHYYEVELPMLINEATEAFDDSVLPNTLNILESPLMNEVASNLDECQTDKQREKYIYSLLTPLKSLCDKLHPVAEISRLKGDLHPIIGIRQCQQELEMWQQIQQGEPSGVAKEQIEACERFIERYRWQIQRLQDIANKYCDLLGKFEDGAKWMQEGTVENCLSAFWRIAHRFGMALDALLLERGINLLWYQQQCGIYLIVHRDITTLREYLGSVELVVRYIDEALPKIEEPQQGDNTELQPQQSTLPDELNTPKANDLLQKAINAGLCTEDFVWLETKALLAYFGARASEYLGICEGEYNGKKKANWKPFEILFNVKDLKDAKKGYVRYGGTPKNHTIVDAIFD